MRPYILLAISVIIFSTILRLGFPEQAHFRGDEDNIAREVHEYIEKHSFPSIICKAHGITSISFFGGFLYLIMSYVKDPQIIILLAIGIPSVLGVLLCFLFAYRFLNKNSALVAVSLYGSSVWSIFYTKNLWGANIVPLLVILVFYLLTWSILKKTEWPAIISVLLLFTLPGLHLTSYSIILSVIIIAFLKIYTTNRKTFFYLTVITGILSTTILTIVLLKHTRIPIVANNFSLKGFYYSLRLMTTDSWFYSFTQITPRYPFVNNAVNICICLLFFSGCIKVIKEFLNDFRFNKLSVYSIIGIWYLTFIITFGFTNLTSYAHYFLAISPALFLIAGIGFQYILEHFSEREKFHISELLFLSVVLALWNPWMIFILLPVIFLWTGSAGVLTKFKFYFLHLIIAFIITFRFSTDLAMSLDIKKQGGIPGEPGLDLGQKMKILEFVITDAQKRFNKTGLCSNINIVNDEGYGYLYKYYKINEKEFINKNTNKSYFLYNIINDPNKRAEIPSDFKYKYFGNKLLIIRKM